MLTRGPDFFYIFQRGDSPCAIAIKTGPQAAASRFYHYVVVRKDMPLGQLAAQITHAAGESGLPSPPNHVMHVVVLATPNEEVLARVEDRLAQLGIEHVAVREPDLQGSLTALGVSPVSAGAGQRYAAKALGNLPLLRGYVTYDVQDKEDGAVRCSSCGSLAEHTLRGWACTGSEKNKARWVPVTQCGSRTGSSTTRERSASGGEVALVQAPPRPFHPSVAQSPSGPDRASASAEGRGVRIPPGGSARHSELGG